MELDWLDHCEGLPVVIVSIAKNHFGARTHPCEVPTERERPPDLHRAT